LPVLPPSARAWWNGVGEVTAREQADTGMEDLAREFADRAWDRHALDNCWPGHDDMAALFREFATRWADKVRREQMEADCAALRDWGEHQALEVLRRAFQREEPPEWAEQEARHRRDRLKLQAESWEMGEPPDEKREEDR
jgi:hypothetical protein